MSLSRSPLGVLFAGLALCTFASAQTPDFSRPYIDPAAEAPQPDSLPAHMVGAGPVHKLRVDASDQLTLQQLAASDVVLRQYDYGSFVVFVVDGTKLDSDALFATGFDVRDEYDLVAFNGLTLNGAQPEALLSTLPDGLRLSTPGGALAADAGLFVVQFDGPVRDDWLAALDATGALRVHHMPMNAYVVKATPAEASALEGFAAANAFVQYAGALEPAFRIHEDLRALIERAPDAPVKVTIQLVDRPGIRGVIEDLAALSFTGANARVVQQYVNVEATLLPRDFARLARLADVFQIEPLGELSLFDEAQGQITAGNLSGNSPSGPGYLAWLASQGFGSGQFTSFSVNVVDDATSLTGHPDLPNSRIDFANNPTNQTGAQGGHGFLNTNIIGGFNSGTGSANEDSLGYNYGLGIAPWAHVGATAIFGGTSSSGTSWESTAYGQGARISSNSWGFQTQTGGAVADYNASAQEYDGIVRDAQGGSAGNQGMMIVFAAGNNGSGSNTVSSPATAKNVLTVGASENVRQTGTDGCAIGNSGANSANDIISFSSRGPVNSSGGDGRWKPEIVAPGTHIEAGIPQSNYNGSSVCNQYWPSGQTLYGWSSGTSHSTPAIAGVSALVYQWFLNQGFGAPSPAMNKAFIVATGDYMNGVGANDTLPSNSQGMGRANLSDAFAGSNRLLEDEVTVLGATGQTFTTSGNVASSAKPFRVVLAWTDAPGPTSGAPWINDLDLEVTVGGTTYKGNVFSGANSIGGGSADTKNNTESVFLPAGTSGSFSITVRASSIAGDGVPGNGDGTDQDFALIVTNASTGGPVLPTANFAGSPTTGIAPLAVSFTDSSSATVTSWSWSFGDGATSTLQNPSHTYANPGNYTVALTATDSVGSDTNTKTNYIVASAPPVPGISDGSFEAQAAASAPTAPWTIDFGTGHIVNTNADNGLPTNGAQWLELSASSTNNSTPPSNPGGVTNPPSGGAGVSQSFSYAAGVTLFSFDAAFSRNEGANQGTYNDWMSVDITDGSTWQNLYYADTFTATPNTSATSGFPMTAITSVSVDLAGLFPGSNAATNFTVTALVGNKADSVQASPGFVDNFALTGSAPAPTANFSGTPLSGTAPLVVGFTDASSVDVTGWSWSFGDGATSTLANPNHTYNAAGTYTVALTVTGPGGTDTLTRSGYVNVSAAPPVASFTGTPTTGTAPLAVNFTDGSSGSVSSYAWSFGDGATSSLANPSHSYAAAGTYTVALTVTGPGGTDTQTRANYISVNEPAPTASFTGTPTSGTVPLVVSFSDASTGTVTSRSWTFGDGATSTLANPSHTYSAVGTYSVSLTVTGPGGSDTLTRTNYISVADLPPTAGFTGTPLSGTAPLLVSFADASSVDVTAWSWTFGDGATSTLANPNHTYNAAGTFTVALTVTGPGGTDTLTRSGYISVSEPPPVAGFTGTPTSGTAPLAVSFSNASTGNVTSSSWTFGDGSTSTLANPSHTYTGVGTYSVTLTVTGPGGTDSLTRTNYISVAEPAPVAGFSGTPTSGTAPLAVSFSDSSTGNITSRSWTFGDGATSTLANPSHTYSAVGSYSVTLTVTGPGGTDSLTRTNYITVGDVAPVAGFSGTPTSGVAPLAVSFADASSGNVASYSWSFGDGATSSLQNPSHTYTAAGTFTVTLTVTGPGGSDALTRTNYIAVSAPPVPPTASFSATPTAGTNPLTVSFTDSSTGDVTGWSWTFGDGATSTLQHPNHTYTAAGTYTVSLTASGPAGSDTQTQTGLITVTDPPVGGTKNYMSFLSTTTVPGLGTVRDEDIVAFDAATGTWEWIFDGSDVGVGGTDVNAFSIRADGSILMSFNSTSTSVPGLTGGPNGTTVEDSDVVLFTPTSTGATTAGSFSFYLDGSDVGLTTNGEDIDAMHENADGSLSISTLGSHTVSGLSKGRDEDVITIALSATGANSAGTWSVTFDGSDVGFATSSGEDIDAISFDAGDMLFSTQGSFAVNGASGADEDVGRFAGSFGSTTSGSATLELDLSLLGIDVSEDIDGLTIR